MRFGEVLDVGGIENWDRVLKVDHRGIPCIRLKMLHVIWTEDRDIRDICDIDRFFVLLPLFQRLGAL